MNASSAKRRWVKTHGYHLVVAMRRAPTYTYQLYKNGLKKPGERLACILVGVE